MKRSSWLLIAAVAALLIFAAYWNTRGEESLDFSVISEGSSAVSQVVVHPMTMMKMNENYDPLTTGCLYGERTGDVLYVTEAYFDGTCAGLNALGNLVMHTPETCELTVEEYLAVSDGHPIVGMMCGDDSVRFYGDDGYIGEWK
jgi:hypothetical protein